MTGVPAQRISLKSYEFRAEREAIWRELEALVAQVEKRGLPSLSAEQLARLPVLYRATLSSLSVARGISLDRNVVEYLEGLAGRAYFCVYGARRQLGDAVRDFVWRAFPVAVRQAGWSVAVATICMLLGVAAAFFLTLADGDRFYSFVSVDYAQGRGPASSTDDLRAVLYDDGGPAEMLTTFASFLFTNNAGIGLLAFALGFVLGVPVFLLMFINGAVLGAFAALHYQRGLSLDFWGWVLPHGVTELLAVILCGGAGLVLARSVVFPGRHSRLHELAVRGRDAGRIVVGAVVLFFLAAVIEGVFRQTVHSVPVRYALACATALLWIVYFGWAGRGAARGPGEEAS